MGKCLSKNKNEKIFIVTENLLNKPIVVLLQKGKIKMNGYYENGKLTPIKPPIIIDSKMGFQLDLKHIETEQILEYSEKYSICRRSFIKRGQDDIVTVGFYWECCGSREEYHNPIQFHGNEIEYSIKHPFPSKY